MRAQQTFQDIIAWFPKNYPGRQLPTKYWVASMSKFNTEERRWVNKGPVILYYLAAMGDAAPLQLVANYLYSTKSIALNFRVFEHMGIYAQWPSSSRSMVFSTCRFNFNIQINTQSVKVPLSYFFPGVESFNFLPVFKCESFGSAIQEDNASIFSLKFLSGQGLHTFFCLFFVKPIVLKCDNRTSRFPQCVQPCSQFL